MDRDTGIKLVASILIVVGIIFLMSGEIKNSGFWILAGLFFAGLYTFVFKKK